MVRVSFSKHNNESKINKLIDELASRFLHEELIEEIIDELAKFGDDAIPALANACKSQSLNKRKYAPLALGEIWLHSRSTKASQALVEALKYPDADNTAFAVLFEIRDKSIIPELFNIIWKVRPWNREGIAELVFEFGTEEQIKKMESLLKKVEKTPDPGLPDDYPLQ